MYIIEIINKKTGELVGPTILVSPQQEYTKITAGMIAAQQWLVKQELESGEYRIVPRPVGCL